MSIMNICIENEDDLNIDGRYRKQILDLIRNYKPNKNVETDIKTTIVLRDETPIYCKPRRLAPLEKKVLDQQVQDWIKDGRVKESSSDFASPVVLVRKKDGSYRVCVDYRKLNDKIIKDRFPIPSIEDQIDKLVKAKVYSTIDLKNGFFHVPVAEQSQKYTAFLTIDNQYEFLRTPFGLCNSPASFGRFISSVFKNLIRDGTVIHYVDDLIIPSNNEIEGIEKLKRTLQVAASAGIQINWKKCQFLQVEVEYLGYLIKGSCIKPSPKNIKAVIKFPKPSNIKQLQSFLGLTSYFRKFVPNYAKIASPLTNLLKKEKEFEFGSVEMESFEGLKKILSDEPVLQLFDPDAITEVHTDACQEGLAAVLLQKRKNEDHFHPIYYASRATTPAEKRYHSYLKCWPW